MLKECLGIYLRAVAVHRAELHFLPVALYLIVTQKERFKGGQKSLYIFKVRIPDGK